ncbi:hypothetical protein [Rhizobium phage RHph_I40]|uniref:Lipoprotein n=1 Tax=Rhizobium phage RHph_I38 TaxID=2509734 RepID=A0A7S5R902_9CAUD|nr:hypothetical protein EVC01_019 [Rhizobium phage RHph_I38]QXV73648.1 hypothetical protein [Rhizobium phage RHph_I40]
MHVNEIRAWATLVMFSIIIAATVTLAGCGYRHNDGMEDLWKGVKCVQENNCRSYYGD